MRRNELRFLEVARRRVRFSHEGDDAVPALGQPRSDATRVRGILGLIRDVWAHAAAALTGVTQDNEVRTHGRLPVFSNMRHHDSLIRTQQEQNLLDRLIRVAAVAGALWITVAAPGALAGEAQATACGGRVHNVEGRNALYATSGEAQCPWGFLVDKLVIFCEQREGYDQNFALTAVTEDGRSFALNGTAGQWFNLPSIRPIWKEREDIPGARIDLTPWMKAGEALCDISS